MADGRYRGDNRCVRQRPNCHNQSDGSCCPGANHSGPGANYRGPGANYRATSNSYYSGASRKTDSIHPNGSA